MSESDFVRTNQTPRGATAAPSRVKRAQWNDLYPNAVGARVGLHFLSGELVHLG